MDIDSEPEPHEAELLAELKTVYLTLGDVPYEEIVAAFEQVGERMLPKLERMPQFALEVQRRVADGILVATIEYLRPLRECIAVLERLKALGWSDLYHKAQTLDVVATYCRKKRRKDLGLHYIEPLVAELEAARAAFGEPWIDNALPILRRLLARLEPKKPAG
jgi:hypothetical protein